MAKRVLKYPIGHDGPGTVLMPEGSRVLSVEWQGETLVAWALTDDGVPMVERSFIAALTGMSLPTEVDGFEFVGTVQFGIPRNSHMPYFVVHVFFKSEG